MTRHLLGRRQLLKGAVLGATGVMFVPVLATAKAGTASTVAASSPAHFELLSQIAASAQPSFGLGFDLAKLRTYTMQRLAEQGRA